MGNCSASSDSRSGSYGSGARDERHATVETKSSTMVLHDGPILSISYVSRQQVLTSSDDKSIAVIDVDGVISSKSTSLEYLRGHKKAVNKIIHSASNPSAAYSASRDLSIKSWDLEKMACYRTIDDAHELNITGLATHSIDPACIFSGSRDYSVKCWDINSGICKTKYTANRNVVTTLATSVSSPDLLYQGSEDLAVRIWDTRSSGSRSVPAETITGYVYFPVSMDINKEGNLLATGCKGFDSVGCTVKVWDLRNTSKELFEFVGHSQDAVGCKFSSVDNNVLFSASKDGSVCAWDVSIQAQGCKDGGHCVASNPSTGKLITCVDVPAVASSAAHEVSSESQHNIAVGANDGSLMFASMANASCQSPQRVEPYFSTASSVETQD